MRNLVSFSFSSQPDSSPGAGEELGTTDLFDTTGSKYGVSSGLATSSASLNNDWLETDATYDFRSGAVEMVYRRDGTSSWYAIVETKRATGFTSLKLTAFNETTNGFMRLTMQGVTQSDSAGFGSNHPDTVNGWIIRLVQTVDYAAGTVTATGYIFSVTQQAGVGDTRLPADALYATGTLTGTLANYPVQKYRAGFCFQAGSGTYKIVPVSLKVETLDEINVGPLTLTATKNSIAVAGYATGGYPGDTITKSIYLSTVYPSIGSPGTLVGDDFGTIENLTPNTDYYFMLHAVNVGNGADNGVWSNVFYARTFGANLTQSGADKIVLGAIGDSTFEACACGYSRKFNFNATTDVSTANDTITITAHGFVTGDPILLGGTMPTGLSVGGLYYAIYVNANTIKLASTRVNAYLGTGVDLTATATGIGVILGALLVPQMAGILLSAMVGGTPDAITVVNRAKSGASAGASGTCWRPADGSGLLTGAVADFISAGVTHIIFNLGLNDLANKTTPANFAAYIDEIFTYILAQMPTVKILVVGMNWPNGYGGSIGGLTGITHLEYSKKYDEALAAMVDGVSVFMCDFSSYNITRARGADGVNMAARSTAFSFDSTAAVNTTTDTITLPAHGRSKGWGPVRVGGAIPTGLVADKDYWLIVPSSGSIKLADSYNNALAYNAVDITAAAVGTCYIYELSFDPHPLPFANSARASGIAFEIAKTLYGMADPDTVLATATNFNVAGTVVLPTVSTVLDGTNYGANSELTGTLQSPGDAAAGQLATDTAAVEAVKDFIPTTITLLGVVGTWGEEESLVDEITSAISEGSFNGSNQVTVSTVDSGNSAISSVLFTVENVGTGRTNESGELVIGLADGTWTVSAAPVSGIVFESVTITVPGDTEAVLVGQSVSITPSPVGQVTMWTISRDSHGDILSGINIQHRLIAVTVDGTYEGSWVDSEVAGDDGIIEIVVPASSTCQFRKKSGGELIEMTAPATGTKEIDPIIWKI